MRIVSISKVYFILFILAFSFLTFKEVRSESLPENETVLVTRITEVSLQLSNDGMGFTEYIFEVKGEVLNKDSNSVLIEHPNRCKFGVYINPVKIQGEASIYSSISCVEAITTATYSPGLTNYSMVAAVVVQSGISTSLPDGFYEITFGEPFKQVYQQQVTFLKSSMTISEGEIKFDYSSFDSEVVTIPPVQTVNPPDESVNPVSGDIDVVAEPIIADESQEVIIEVNDVIAENPIVKNEIFNADIIGTETESVNLNINLIFISLSLFIGTVRFARSKY